MYYAPVLPWDYRLPVVRVVTAPTTEPLSLAEAKSQIRVDQDFNDDDAYIQILIGAAREFCESRKGYSFAEQTLEYSLPYFPGCDAIELPRATPLQSIVSVKYTDSDNVEATWDAADYLTDTDSIPGRLVLKSGASYPSFTPQTGNAVRIRYIAGLEDSPAVPIPSRIKLAMGLLIGHWYENREATIVGFQHAEELALTVRDLMGIDQLIWVC
jgi:uncharacterized phiE125 gp8 family phage protein